MKPSFCQQARLAKPAFQGHALLRPPGTPAEPGPSPGLLLRGKHAARVLVPLGPVRGRPGALWGHTQAFAAPTQCSLDLQPRGASRGCVRAGKSQEGKGTPLWLAALLYWPQGSGEHRPSPSRGCPGGAQAAQLWAGQGACSAAWEPLGLSHQRWDVAGGVPACLLLSATPQGPGAGVPLWADPSFLPFL